MWKACDRPVEVVELSLGLGITKSRGRSVYFWGISTVVLISKILSEWEGVWKKYILLKSLQARIVTEHGGPQCPSQILVPCSPFICS